MWPFGRKKTELAIESITPEQDGMYTVVSGGMSLKLDGAFIQKDFRGRLSIKSQDREFISRFFSDQQALRSTGMGVELQRHVVDSQINYAETRLAALDQDAREVREAGLEGLQILSEDHRMKWETGVDLFRSGKMGREQVKDITKRETTRSKKDSTEVDEQGNTRTKSREGSVTNKSEDHHEHDISDIESGSILQIPGRIMDLSTPGEEWHSDVSFGYPGTDGQFKPEQDGGSTTGPGGFMGRSVTHFKRTEGHIVVREDGPTLLGKIKGGRSREIDQG